MTNIINLNTTTTSLSGKICALYNAMKKAGDENLTFEISHHLTRIADSASFIAKQRIFLDQARVSMKPLEYKMLFRCVSTSVRYASEEIAMNINALNAMSKKYSVPLVAGAVDETARKETDFARKSLIYTDFAKEVLNARFTAGSAGSSAA